MGKYTQIFEQHLWGKLISLLKSNESKEKWTEEWSLPSTLFSNAGDRIKSGYNFCVIFHDGKCSQKLSGSAVARDLRNVIEEHAQSSMYSSLFKGKTIEIRMNKSCKMTIAMTSSESIVQTLAQTDKPCSPEVLSLPPIVDKLSEILILGTMPGEESLKTKEYYAKNSNIFWNIISNIFNEGKVFSTYKEKVECVRKHHIAIWDTLHSCLREGSTDTTIRNGEPNEIDNFLEQYPSIKKIVFNGKKALSYYKPSIPYSVALSTSPANRQYSDEERTKSWEQALQI